MVNFHGITICCRIFYSRCLEKLSIKGQKMFSTEFLSISFKKLYLLFCKIPNLKLFWISLKVNSNSNSNKWRTFSDFKGYQYKIISKNCRLFWQSHDYNLLSTHCKTICIEEIQNSNWKLFLWYSFKYVNILDRFLSWSIVQNWIWFQYHINFWQLGAYNNDW